MKRKAAFVSDFDGTITGDDFFYLRFRGLFLTRSH